MRNGTNYSSKCNIHDKIHITRRSLNKNAVFIKSVKRNIKMVPFCGTVYKSILYDLIIPFPRGRNGKNDVRLFLRPGIQFNYKFFMDSFLCGMAPITDESMRMPRIQKDGTRFLAVAER